MDERLPDQQPYNAEFEPDGAPQHRQYDFCSERDSPSQHDRPWQYNRPWQYDRRGQRHQDSQREDLAEPDESGIHAPTTRDSSIISWLVKTLRLRFLCSTRSSEVLYGMALGYQEE